MRLALINKKKMDIPYHFLYVYISLIHSDVNMIIKASVFFMN